MVEVEEVTEAPPRLDMEADSDRWRICSNMEPVPLALLWLLRRETTSVSAKQDQGYGFILLLGYN